MTIFVALDEAEYQVPDVEGPTPHPTAVVLVQHLLVLSQAEEGNFTCLIELIHGILEGCLGSLLVVLTNPRCSVVEVSWEDRLGTVDLEERCVADRPAGVILKL